MPVFKRINYPASLLHTLTIMVDLLVNKCDHHLNRYT